MPELYLVSGSKFDMRNDHLETIEMALRGGVGVVQLREPNLEDAKLLKMAFSLRALTKKYGALFIVNDRPDIAIIVKADGVHLGQKDLGVEEVRKILPKEMIIGKSTHSYEQAVSAVESGVDYIGVGPVFTTNSKIGVCAAVGVEYVAEAATKLDIPFVAIGGIKLKNLAQVLDAGAKTIGCITAIISSQDPYSITTDFVDKIRSRHF